MRCTRCDTESGEAPSCPACGGPTAPPAVPEPAISPNLAQSQRRGWLTTLITIAIAIALGVGAALLTRKLGPQAEPVCEELCKFSDVPLVVKNPTWQAQIAEAHCRCNALHKAIPPAQPIDHPPVH